MISSWGLGYYAFFQGLIMLIGLSFAVRKLSFAYKLLGLFLMTMGFILFATFMFQSGLMSSYPNLFRSSSPFHYLLGPLFYFFVLFLFYPSKKWRIVYWLHFLPFLLHTIELLPLFLLSPAEKLAIYKNNLAGVFEEVRLGLFTYRFHAIFKSLLVLVYSLLCFNIIRPLIFTARHPVFMRNALLIKWIFIEVILKFVTAGFIFFSFAFHSYLPASMARMWEYTFFLDGVFTGIFLLVNPRLLQGVQWNDISISEIKEEIAPKKIKKPVDPAVSLVMPEEENVDIPGNNLEKAEIIKAIDEYMQMEQPFLQQDFSISRMASEIGEKPYLISKAIKEHYGISYTDLVNTYRFNYIKEHIKTDSKWQQFSLEAMIYQAGFGSRNAFYTAFRKLHPETSPTQFFNLRG